MGEADHQLAVSLSDVIPRGSRVASNTQWARTTHIAFANGLRYFGELQPGATGEGALAQLDRHVIDYFLVWDSGPVWPFTDGWIEVSAGRVAELRIYRVEHDAETDSLNGDDQEPAPRG